MSSPFLRDAMDVDNVSTTNNSNVVTAPRPDWLELVLCNQNVGLRFEHELVSKFEFTHSDTHATAAFSAALDRTSAKRVCSADNVPAPVDYLTNVKATCKSLYGLYVDTCQKFVGVNARKYVSLDVMSNDTFNRSVRFLYTRLRHFQHVLVLQLTISSPRLSHVSFVRALAASHQYNVQDMRSLANNASFFARFELLVVRSPKLQSVDLSEFARLRGVSVLSHRMVGFEASWFGFDGTNLRNVPVKMAYNGEIITEVSKIGKWVVVAWP